MGFTQSGSSFRQLMMSLDIVLRVWLQMMGIVLPRLSMGCSPQLGTHQSQVIMGHLPMVVWRLILTLGFNQPSVGKVTVYISCFNL